MDISDVLKMQQVIAKYDTVVKNNKVDEGQETENAVSGLKALSEDELKEFLADNTEAVQAVLNFNINTPSGTSSTSGVSAASNTSGASSTSETSSTSGASETSSTSGASGTSGVTTQNAISEAEKQFGKILNTFAGTEFPDEVVKNLKSELLTQLQNGSSGNIKPENLSNWIKTFREKYSVDESMQSSLEEALQGLSHNGTLSIYDVGRATTGLAILSLGNGENLTKENLDKIMGMQWDNRSDYSTMADKIRGLGINVSKDDIIAVLNSGDTDTNKTLNQSEQKTIGIAALRYSSTGGVTPSPAPVPEPEPEDPHPNKYDEQYWKNYLGDLFYANDGRKIQNLANKAMKHLHELNYSSADNAKALKDIIKTYLYAYTNWGLNGANDAKKSEEWQKFQGTSENGNYDYNLKRFFEEHEVDMNEYLNSAKDGDFMSMKWRFNG